MSYNYQKELLRMLREHDSLITECRKAGMADDAILEIIDFDVDQFNSDRAFYRRTSFVDFYSDVPDDSGEPADAFARQCLEAVANDDEYFLGSYGDRLEVFSNPKLYEAHKTLTPLQRTVWEMYAFEGYTEREIAEKLGTAQQTVSRHLLRIRKKLKKFSE